MGGLVLADAAPTASKQLTQSLVLIAIAVAVCAPYVVGARRLVAARRGPAGAWRSWAWRRWAFCGGVLVAMIAVSPPLDPIVDASFPLHMVQHEVLMFIAAPLFALGAPGLPWLMALPHRGRRRVARVRAWPPVRRLRAVAALPVMAVIFFYVVIFGWHVPQVYDLALANDTVHEAEHACFLFASWWLFAPLAAPRHRLEGGLAVLYMFLSGFPMIGIGAGLAMATHALYPAQTGTGAGAVAEQQAAGVIMWVPPTFVAVALGVVLIGAWLRGMERDNPAGDQLPDPTPPPLPAGGAPASLVPSAGRRSGRRPG